MDNTSEGSAEHDFNATCRKVKDLKCTSKEIRLTEKENNLYAICLDWLKRS